MRAQGAPGPCRSFEEPGAGSGTGGCRREQEEGGLPASWLGLPLSRDSEPGAAGHSLGQPKVPMGLGSSICSFASVLSLLLIPPLKIGFGKDSLFGGAKERFK